MPTYDYECSKCGKKFEKFHRMTEDPVAKCPECGGKSARLISSGSGVIFKGSGFYETDYKRNKDSKDSASCPSPKGDSCKGCSLNKKEKGG